MAKKIRKSLPDLRQAYESPDETGESGVERPTSEEVTGLANRHGFSPDFDLETKIEESWEWWREDRGIGPAPTRSDRLKLLKAISARAEALKEALDLMGALEMKLVADSSSEALDLSQLRESCQSLQSAAIIATARVPTSRAGKHGDPHSIELLCGLFRIWGEAFGPDAPRITRNEAYSGPFFDFAEGVFRLFGIRKTNSGLGRAIEKAIASVDRKERVSPKLPKKKR